MITQGFLSFFSYDQAQLSSNVPKYCSRRTLQDFERFPKGFDIGNEIVKCLESIYGANKMHLQIDVYLLFLYYSELDVMLVSL